MSLQLSRGDTCRIRVWFKWSHGHFYIITNVWNGDSNEEGFSNTTSTSEPLNAVLKCYIHDHTQENVSQTKMYADFQDILTFIKALRTLSKQHFINNEPIYWLNVLTEVLSVNQMLFSRRSSRRTSNPFLSVIMVICIETVPERCLKYTREHSSHIYERTFENVCFYISPSLSDIYIYIVKSVI